MSGAYSNRFAEELFVYEYADLVSKSFADDEYARHFYAAADLRVKARFLGFHARLGDLLRERGVAPWDPFLEPEDVEGEDAIDALETFPCAVRVRLRRAVDFTERLVLTLREPIASKGLLADAVSLLAPVDRHATPSPEDAIRGAFLPKPLAAVRLGTFFGLFVGSTVETREEPAARLRTRFSQVLEALFPAVEERLSDPAKIAALGLSGARPLAEALAGRLAAGKDPALLFNPRGPLYDTFARESADLGSVRCILLFAPARVDAGRERLDAGFLDWFGERARRVSGSSAGRR